MRKPTGTEPPSGLPSAGQVSPSARPWIKRDPNTGLFTGDGQGADPAVRADTQRFEAELLGALGNAPSVGQRAIAQQAVIAYGIVARLAKQVEARDVVSKAGRLRAALKALETWQSRLVELLALLGLDKPAPVDPMAAFNQQMERMRAAREEPRG